jgi:hypothetical protein
MATKTKTKMKKYNEQEVIRIISLTNVSIDVMNKKLKKYFLTDNFIKDVNLWLANNKNEQSEILSPIDDLKSKIKKINRIISITDCFYIDISEFKNYQNTKNSHKNKLTRIKNYYDELLKCVSNLSNEELSKEHIKNIKSTITKNKNFKNKNQWFLNINYQTTNQAKVHGQEK